MKFMFTQISRLLEIYGFLKDITEKKSVDVRKEFESLNNHQKEEIEYLISSGLLRLSCLVSRVP